MQRLKLWTGFFVLIGVCLSLSLGAVYYIQKPVEPKCAYNGWFKDLFCANATVALKWFK